MDQSTRLWFQTNKYLLITFTILLLVTIPLCVYMFTLNLPTIFYYLGQGGFSKVEKRILATQNFNPQPDQKTASLSGKALNTLKIVAKKTEYIEIGDCKPYPAIAHIPRDATTILLKNSTNKNHTLTFLNGNTYTIQAYKELLIPANFPYSPYLYLYTCDTSADPVGAFWITLRYIKD